MSVPGWVRIASSGRCRLCRRWIAPGGLSFDAGPALSWDGHTCLSCMATAAAPAVLGRSDRITVVPYRQVTDCPDSAYSIHIDGVEIGRFDLEHELAADADVEMVASAVLSLIFAKLSQHAAEAGRVPWLANEMAGHAADSWRLTMDAPVGQWVLVWYSTLAGLESWTPGIYKAPAVFGKPVWHFTYKQEPNPSLTVLAWKRGPARPAWLVKAGS